MDKEFYLDFNLCQDIIRNISRVIVGKKASIDLLMVALLADGHVLLEDVPGGGKTLIAKCLAKSIGRFMEKLPFTHSRSKGPGRPGKSFIAR